jgi:hypothetical protein
MGLLTVVLLAGCGGGSHQPEEQIANAAQREEKAKGDLLLAEVENFRPNATKGMAWSPASRPNPSKKP